MMPGKDGETRAKPLLPAEELQAYVEYYFNKRSIYLNAFQKKSVPVYLLEKKVIEKKTKLFKKAFQKQLPDTAFYYAMKSNNCPELVKAVINSGFGLDVSSGLELAAALQWGAGDIFFSGPGKTDSELKAAVERSEVTTILVDSFGELHRLESIAASINKSVRIGIRLTIDTTGLWRKFGILPEDLPLFYKAAMTCSHIFFEGIQFHSSWNMTPENQIMFIRRLGTILSGLPGHFKNALKFIDIGGGYWPPQGEWLHHEGTREGAVQKAMGAKIESELKHYKIMASPIETFAADIGNAVQEYIFPVVKCRICFEPGRWISNDAMHLLMSVVDKKTDDLVITDAGTNAVGWERFETDYFPVLNLTRPSFDEKPCRILGSLCTPHDVWGYTYWGKDIQPGDVLMIPTQGAYTYSLQQNFIKPLPEVAIV